MKGETVMLDEEEAPMRAEVVDLAERLRRSLAAAGGTRKTRAAKGAKTSKRAAKTGRKRAA